MPPRLGGSRGGFTLIEVVVVLVILGVMLTLVAPLLRTDSPAPENNLAGLVQYARAAAIHRGEVLELEVQPSGEWHLTGQARTGGDPVGAGRVGPQSAAIRLVFSPLGMCAPAIGAPATESLPLDPLDCELIVR